MGNVTNQNFISIPYKTLINMIEYKAGEQIIKIKAS
jgi:putative transposase